MCKSNLIVALDYVDQASALRFVDTIEPEMCRLKIGKQLFVAAGPSLVELLIQRGFDVFLDLKFHDIPHTVAQAVKAAAALGVWMLTLHACGGERMLSAAYNALQHYRYRPRLIAVTVLTSMNPQDLQRLDWPSAAILAPRLAALAQHCACDGVVCSGQEAALIRGVCGSNFTLVVPGIRLDSIEKDDQTRVMTPQQALAAGADYLVIGRPITTNIEPKRCLQLLNTQLNS